MPPKKTAGRRAAARAAKPPDAAAPPPAAVGALTAGAAGPGPGGPGLDPVVLDGELLASVRELIAAARQHVAQSVNAMLVLLYWEVGTRLQRDVLQEGRAAYGRQAVARLADELTRGRSRACSTSAPGSRSGPRPLWNDSSPNYARRAR